MSTIDATTKDQVFLADLNEIFKKNFSAKIYPTEKDEVLEVKVNINEGLTRNQLNTIMSVSDKHSLTFLLSRSGAGLVINFKRKV